MKERPQADRLGARGEKIAAAFLKRIGYRILARNFTCPVGEIDIVALDGDEIVIAEVKTLRDAHDIHPAESVHAGKQARLRRTARYYLSLKKAEDSPARFDVLAVVLPEKGKPEVEHIRDAF